MNGVFQDLIGNLVMLAVLFISARKTPRRKNFLIRLVLGFVLFSLIRHTAFSLINAQIPWEERELPSLIVFAAFIPMLAATALVCWEMDFWAALYCGSSAYCLQHITNTGYDIIRHYCLSDAAGFILYLFYIWFIDYHKYSLVSAILLYPRILFCSAEFLDYP